MNGHDVTTPGYDALARFYDLDHVDYDDDLAMYHEFARAVRGPILDVGTGTGRVALHLARKGAHVIGIDESPAMLAVAEKKRAAAGKLPGKVEFRQVDVRQFETDERFGVAIVALNTFAHFLTAADQFAALAALHRVMRPNGLVLLDLWNPTASNGTEASGELLHGYTRQEPQTNNLVTQTVATTADRGRQLLHVTIWYDVTDEHGGQSRITVTMTTRYCYRYELEWMLLHAGFVTDHVYGDYDLSAYRGHSPRLLVATRAVE